MKFLGFYQRLYQFRYICFFAFNTEVSECQNFSQKQHVWEKYGFSELWSKNLKSNHNAGFFKLEYLTNKVKFNFWM